MRSLPPGTRNGSRSAARRTRPADVIRATFEVEPPAAAETLALIESGGRADGPEHVRGRVVELQGARAVIEFPAATNDVALLVASLFAGEWADSAAFTRCRLAAVDWPDAFLPGPAFDAADKVLVGAIVKPSLGLSPDEVAATAAQLAAAGAGLLQGGGLLGGPGGGPPGEGGRASPPAGGHH